MKPSIRRGLVAGLLSSLVGAAAAHTGHGTQGLQAGLAHPFGADHLLAMVAVGLWSARALPAARRWWGPAAFLLALVAGAALGVGGMRLPFVEPAIAASVVVLGAMLVAGARLSVGAGLGLIAVSAAFHGLAHGAEIPAGAGFATYGLGFVATTALLHGSGLLMGQYIQRAWRAAWPLLGGLAGAAGLLMLVRL